MESSAGSSSDADWAPVIDTHAHIFLRELPLVGEATHRPEKSLTDTDYLSELDQASVRYGVLTAPSFLGTYNDYSLEALRRSNGRLRATVIVDPEIDPYTLKSMDRDGVVGIRFSLRRYATIPDLTSPPYRRLLRRVQDLGWYVHILAETDRLATMVPVLADSGVKLVIDHFGVPEKLYGVDDPGSLAVLRAIERGQTWVKLSAPYRVNGQDMKALANRLLAAAGPDRLLWGSDWPWTSHENRFTYKDTIAWFKDWIPDRATREAIGQSALQLNGIS